MRPLWIRKQGAVVVVWQDGRLISYDREGEVEDLGVRGSRSDTYQRSLHVDNYMSSLVLLERGSDYSDATTGSSLPTLQTDDGDNVGSSSGSDHERESRSVCIRDVEV